MDKLMGIFHAAFQDIMAIAGAYMYEKARLCEDTIMYRLATDPLIYLEHLDPQMGTRTRPTTHAHMHRHMLHAFVEFHHTFLAIS